MSMKSCNKEFCIFSPKHPLDKYSHMKVNESLWAKGWVEQAKGQVFICCKLAEHCQLQLKS